MRRGYTLSGWTASKLRMRCPARTPRSAAGAAWRDFTLRESLTAAPVCCSDWILMKALACEDGGGEPSPPFASPPTGGLHYAALPTARRRPILRRRGPARRGPLPRVLDRDGQTRLSRNLTAAPEPFLKAVHSFRDGIVVGCECMHCWYWLADACRDHDLPFALGHALAMKAVHGSKTKCDRHDAEAIARLLREATSPSPTPTPRRDAACAHLLRARL